MPQEEQHMILKVATNLVFLTQEKLALKSFNQEGMEPKIKNILTC